MKRRLPTEALVALGAAVALVACSSNGGGAASGDIAPEMLDAPWAGRTNPLPGDAATVARGEQLFQKNCSPCHGANADGKGAAGVSLNPPPANFRDGTRLASHSDAYLFMRLSEGKRATAMPSFEGALSDDDRWAILRFLRTLPGAAAKAR